MLNLSIFLTVALVIASVSQLSTGYKNPQCRPGRQVIVHLFEWRWDDIALECKRFLGPRNYCGVQVSPPNEHRIFVSTDPSDPTFRPWWERYQPVSHYLDSRSGSAAEFAAMVATCNRHGVRIYVDAVVNHMAMVGGYGRGSGGSYYNAEREDFPGVPFSPRNFNGRDVCPTDDLTIHDYRDAIQVRNCRLLGLVDLRTGTDYVQRYIAKYFNELISLGVAGFRIDAAKHMWPQDIAGILNRTHNLIESEFGPNQRPFVYQEVIDLKGNGEPIKNAEYTPIARVTEFNYGREVGRAFGGSGNLSSLIRFQPGQPDVYLVASEDALVFIDNHDNQRGHGGGSNDILTFRRRKLYEAATAFELVDSYGWPRIMSSYYWEERIVNGKDVNDWIGPPSGPDGTTDQVQIGTDDQCLGRWVCEHRWPAIRRAVQVRAAIEAASPKPTTARTEVGINSIAIARNGLAFYAASTDNGLHSSSTVLQTGLPAGTYCDLMTGEVASDRSRCTAQSVTVRADGLADIQLADRQFAMLIYTGSKLA
ncbi:hypothetical protein BOX15_Mlig014141g1 [Macrostomum lignano]|uniref:Alpha-amylase n=1 Tax=Macrostomum lignano TaxID=282301 RepID=A0A267E050_9PLAT|nr:hypothetical protein BOX15_Mlig014141g1 [Macrostomum lignano]